MIDTRGIIYFEKQLYVECLIESLLNQGHSPYLFVIYAEDDKKISRS